jgi:FKBP-type peptidyl-prolyl cis-trans isomerase SlyD
VRIERGAIVTIQYVILDEGGQVMESSPRHAPVSYLHGFHQIVPALEIALEGGSAGDVCEVELEPDESFGEYDPSSVFAVPRALFGDEDLATGSFVSALSSDGRERMCRVVRLDGDSVVLDMNHPLAGRSIRIAVHVTAVRPASAQELSHGHAHDAPPMAQA